MNHYLEWLYITHISMALFCAALGALSGIVVTLGRRKKIGGICLWIFLWALVLYPVMYYSTYKQERRQLVACQDNREYILYKEICYKPVQAYVPVDTNELSDERVNLIREFRQQP